jgi:two-component system response regulator HydG/two-component system response regulator AtoC
MKHKVLLVDDEINILKVISTALKKEAFQVDTAISGEDALTMIKNGSYNLILSDYKLPGMDGEKLLERVKAKNPGVPFILITAYGTIEQAVKAMKKGAYTYLTKPVNLELLITVVKEVLRMSDTRVSEDISGSSQFLNIIGKSDAILEVFSMIRRVSKTDANVLITGESGTGKELVARAIHYNSLKAGGPFIPLDCTTIPEELVESELFGHEKGAFTCAYESKIGLIEMASGGTIFLDEIGDLDFSLQKKLLRFLQEKEFYRLGGKRKISVDVRVLAATNRNIEEAVERGNFREDLYYRLNVIKIHVPPLRKRREDISLLASQFLENFSKKNRKDIQGLDEEVIHLLEKYDWPGNVRELENTIERAVILCPYNYISGECLPHKLKMLAEEDFSETEEFNLLETERRIILKALEKTSWNQSKSAGLLGISRKKLRTKMKNLSIMPT